jgi:phage-related minor tail protein
MPTAIRGIVFDFRLRTADFVHNMKSINRQLRNLNRLSRRADRELKINPNSYKAFNSHLQVAQARLTSASQKLALYRAELLKLQLNTKTATSRIVNAKNRVAE